jgi:N-acyl-D-amino-acid deacylase
LNVIRDDDIAGAQHLLAAGADPNVDDANHVFALMYAGLYSRPQMVDLLLHAGAAVDNRDSNGLTPLAWAVHSFESAKLLIDAGADVNAKSKIGMTPFLIAAAYPANAPLLRLMIEKGADVHTLALSSSALSIAAYSGDQDSVALLLAKGCDPNVPGFAGFSALHLAAKRGDLRMLQMLLDAGANPNLRTQRAEDVLEQYPLWNDAAFVRLLLARGIDPNRKDDRNHNAALFAASSDTVTPEVFTLLLKASPATDAKGEYGDTALEAALRRGDTRLAKLLGGSVPPVESAELHPVKLSQPLIRNAISASLDLLEKTGPSVVKQRGCFSCHHQGLPSLAAWYVRRSGLAAPQIAETNRKLVYQILQNSNQMMQNGVPPAGEAATVGWELIGLYSDGQPPDMFTDIAANYLAATQLPDGHWPERWGRPPLEYSPISATTVSLRALDLYAIPSRRKEFDEKIRHATAWLAQATPAALEESSMRLLGLASGKAPRAVIDKAARELASEQKDNGAWAQLSGLPADAYATGKALVALRESGYFTSTSPAFLRGVTYLLSTQEPDGSWHVRGRALPLQPLFESGFPHGRDQWISAAGTSWATMALSLAVQSSQ